LDSKLIQQTNLTFRIYVGNRFGQQETNYTQFQINIDRKRVHSYQNSASLLFF